MKQLVGLLIVLMAVVLPSCNFLRERGIIGKKKKADDIALMLARQDSIRVADSIRNAEKAAETAAQAAEPVVPEEKPARVQERVTGVPEGRFNIVVGSFSNHDYALAKADEFRQKGFNAEIIRSSVSNNELVVAESMNSFSRAVSRLESFRSEVDPEAWLYQRR
ncbi:MAG: hypothetical protein MUD02_10415 [Bacteroidales bacterium]|jgi:hypothetical protein|nr:hypothetical protein [Bacteroidales bacterium]MCU0409349.1 hypothetical protein [Bacteroidales bacterium]